MTSELATRGRKGVHRLVLDPEFLASRAQSDLKGAVRKGVASSLISRILVQVIQLGGTVALARLLTPGEYGAAAVALVLAGLANIFTDLGIGFAVVQKHPLEQTDVATAFWVNLGSGVVLTLLFSFLAQPIAALYHRPSLAPVIIVTSLAFTLAASTVHLALLEREFHFGTIGIIDTVATLAGLAVGVTTAALGSGAMSLAYNFVTVALVRTLCAWWVVGNVPTGRVSRDASMFLVRFGRGLVGYNLLNYFSSNIDNAAISRTGGLADLGVYSRAYNLMLLPLYQIQMVMGRVLFPALSSLNDDLPRMRHALQRAIPLLVCAGGPMSMGLAACAPSLVYALYGPRWAEVGPILTALAFVGPPMVLNSALNAGLQALGLTDLQFIRALLNAVSTVIAVVIGVQFGTLGVAVALAVRAYVTLPLTYLPCARRLRISTRIVFRDLLGPVFAIALMGAVVFALRVTGVGLSTLALQVEVGVAAYLALLRFLAPRQVHDALNALGRRKRFTLAHRG